MFTAYQDRIEILSRGNLPPKQTVEGFFAGESIPVNQALSDVFIKLHITEHTGRGVPRITEAYGKDAIRFNENSIVVTISFERLGAEVYEGGQMNPQDEGEIPQVSGQIPQVEGEIPQVNSQVEEEIFPNNAVILLDGFCYRGFSRTISAKEIVDKRLKPSAIH